MQLANALYFPYINIRDSGWLKTAALYYSKLLRIVPEQLKLQDDNTTKILTDELGFVENIDAEHEAREISREFLITMRESSSSPTYLPAMFYKRMRHERQPSLRRIHVHKFSLDTVEALMEMGLAEDWRRSRHPPQWIRIEPRTAAIYMTMLAERMAERRGIPTVTDDPLFQDWLQYFEFNPHRVTLDNNGWRLPRLVIRSAVPGGTDRLPAKRIVEFRRAHDAERLRFFAAVQSMSEDLTKIEDQQSLDQCLQQHQRSIMDAADQLKKALRGVQIDAAVGLLGVSLPPLIAHLVASPSVAMVAGGTAIAAGMTCFRYTQQYARVRDGSPWSYVLSLSRLNARSFLESASKGELLI